MIFIISAADYMIIAMGKYDPRLPGHRSIILFFINIVAKKETSPCFICYNRHHELWWFFRIINWNIYLGSGDSCSIAGNI